VPAVTLPHGADNRSYVVGNGDAGGDVGGPVPFFVGAKLDDVSRSSETTSPDSSLRRHTSWPPCSARSLKGADIATGTRNKARHATRFLSEIVDLCLRSDAKFVSKVYVKGSGSRTVTPPFTQRLARRSSRALTTTSQRLTMSDSASQIPAPRVSTFP
jgi:hypothetical protein